MRFVHNDGLSYGSVFLGLLELHESHAGGYLRSCLTAMLDEVGLDIDDAYKYVTDKGPNFVAAYKDTNSVLFKCF